MQRSCWALGDVSASWKYFYLLLSSSPWPNQGLRIWSWTSVLWRDDPLLGYTPLGPLTQSLRSFPGPLPSTSSNFCPPPSSSSSPSKCLLSFPASNVPASSWISRSAKLVSLLWAFLLSHFLAPQIFSLLALHYIQTHFVLNFVQLFYLQERGPLNLPLTKIFPTPIFSIFLGLYLLWFLYHFIKILEGSGDNYIVNE